jgi:hypothetical protein
MTFDRTEEVTRTPGVLEWMAWRRYLVTTQASSAATYRLTEETAWQRLREELSRLDLSRFQADRSGMRTRRAVPRARNREHRSDNLAESPHGVRRRPGSVSSP